MRAWRIAAIAGLPVAFLVGCGGSAKSGAAPPVVLGTEIQTHFPTVSVSPPSEAPATSEAPLPVVTTPAVPDTTALIAQWSSGGGLTLANAISTALGNIQNSSSDPHSTEVACAELSVAVSNAQAYRPVPDPAIQAHWSAALNDFGWGGTDCTAGLEGNDAETIQRSVSELQSGNAELSQAVTALHGA